MLKIVAVTLKNSYAFMQPAAGKSGQLSQLLSVGDVVFAAWVGGVIIASIRGYWGKIRRYPARWQIPRY